MDTAEVFDIFGSLVDHGSFNVSNSKTVSRLFYEREDESAYSEDFFDSVDLFPVDYLMH